MFRVRTLCGPVVAIVVGAWVAWYPCGPSGPPDDGKERTPAELIVGTWVLKKWDAEQRPWWSTVREEFRADGTYRITSNNAYHLIWLTQRVGQYEVNGKQVRFLSQVTAEEEARNRRRDPADQYHGAWVETIVSISANELTMVWDPNSSPTTRTFRRVR